MLVIPMLVSTLFSDKKKYEKISAPVKFTWYKRFLEKTIEKRGLVIILSILILGVSALLVPQLGSEFMPGSESAEFTVNLKLPDGTSLERTFSTASRTEEIIRELLPDKVKMIYARTGEDKTSTINTSSGLSGENSAKLKVILNDDFATQTEKAIALVETYLKTIPDLEVSFTREESALQSSLGTTTSPFAVEISGEEYAELERIMNEARGILGENRGLYNLTSSIDEGSP
jgi:HAE1 family hydrophobic/amphiphilic exporter-1